MPYKDLAARRECRRRYYERNKEAVLARTREWKSNHPGYEVEWRKNNQGKIAAYREKHRASEFRRFDKLGLKRSETQSLLAEKTHCRLCGDTESKFHLDHILPKSRGGTNRRENLQWLCATCNAAKGALTPDEFISHIRKILARIQ